MNLPPPNDPRFRIYLTNQRQFRLAGCIGCLVGLFVLGGIIGLLVQGWRALLGS